MSTMKSLAVAQYLLDQCKAAGDGSVTPMQLIKLTYIAHGYMLGMHGKPLLDEQVCAWQYGPVVPSVYHAVKGFRSDPVPSVPNVMDPYPFRDDEKDVMAMVAKQYGKHAGITLSSATHKAGTPWSVTWQTFGKSAPISNDLIEGFYASLLKQEKHSAL